jgi:hypothetical protein
LRIAAAACLLGATLGPLLSCRDDGIVAPGGPVNADVQADPFIVMPPPPGTVTITMPVSHASEISASAAAGSFSVRTLVSVVIGGTITGTFNNQPSRQPFYLDPSGILEGGSSCYGNVTLDFSVTGSFRPGPCPLPSGAGLHSAFNYSAVVVNGNGTARRGSAIPKIYLGLCGTPCVYYDGNQTILLVPAASQLIVTASPSSIKAHDPVTFTVDTSGGLQVGIISWTFVPDTGGGTQTTCSPGANPCITTIIATTGTMYVKALIGGPSGQIEQASARVTVICPIGDSLFDKDTLFGKSKQSQVRADLAAMWAATHPTLPETQRREQIGVGYIDASGIVHIANLTGIPGAYSSNCESGLPFGFWNSLPAGYTVIFIIHTHPFTGNDPATGCGTVVYPPGSHYGSGPSDSDSVGAIVYSNWVPDSLKPSTQHTLPSYALDPDSLYAYIPNQPKNAKSPKRYNPKAENGCP